MKLFPSNFTVSQKTKIKTKPTLKQNKTQHQTQYSQWVEFNKNQQTCKEMWSYVSEWRE